jgi:hypothetical protein
MSKSCHGAWGKLFGLLQRLGKKIRNNPEKKEASYEGHPDLYRAIRDTR